MGLNMQVTAEMIFTRGGGFLPLDQRIADALMTYAQHAADAEGMPRQTWCRKYWRLKDYEAKDVLKGNASKTIYERILKMRGAHCGWFVGLAVTGAVIGQPLHEFFREQNERAAREAANALEHERQARAAYRRLASFAADPRDDRDGGETAGETRRRAGAVGAARPRRLD
jgi:hypothetical protein